MFETTFEKHIQQILEAIDTFSEPHRSQLLRLVDESRQRDRQTRESLDAARTALDDWRLARKYMLFDLEARLREAQTNQKGGDRPATG